MRVSRGWSLGIAVVGLVLAGSTIVSAGGLDPSARKTRKKTVRAATPARPSGGTAPPAATDAYYGGTELSTIKSFRNALGQTVYSISPSHSDVSLPLVDLANTASMQFGAAEEEEISENSQLPSFRIMRSDVPDPVVQSGIPTSQSLSSGGFTPTAPATGFNFLGLGSTGLSPSDSNGSVGNNQYVETVNTRYQIWSLDRANKIANSMLGPSNINVLWNGFGGACQAQNSGDPIVVFDKVAGRWLISQFTTSVSGGSYFQCVALSTSANAAGTYTRWAFAVPNGIFGDYPHFGVWSDAYYMMAHGFLNTSGGYVAGLFAAMDRTKMLTLPSGDPTATWQVIQDPSEGGHMPADLDGFAPPPTNTPGIFVSLHSTGMFIYRMKVDFATPSNTVRTLQATVPVAPSTAACGGGSCIPQPGGVNVGSLADRLMFRAAYRNLIDHESLVITHSVDPSVTGVVSGVRWYDFRISGIPDATCSSYPCIYQQGTIADAPSGRSRWMSSIAMDRAENILVGYSTTGKTAGVENHSIRYTGRAKTDPLGTMTVPEATIVTGTANNTNSRWGDYTSMSVDPVDDCTFWYVSQYFTSSGIWSTRVASAVWPTGTGAGQCPAGGCLIRPPSAPTIGSATVPGDNQITLNWTGIAPTPGSYAVERAAGACGSEGMYQPVGSVSGASGTFTDTSVLGGITYSYRVIAATDASGKCQSLVKSGCTSATATGLCSLKPVFTGATTGASADQPNCGVTLNWSPPASSCPLTPNLRYNIYRGTVPDFIASPANRIATCIDGPSSYIDRDNVASGASYYYVVRAEDNSAGNGGPCNGGNEDANNTVVSGTAYGPGTQAAPGTFTDGGGDGTAFMRLNVLGSGNTADQAWRYVKTANDAGANHTPGGAYAYRNAGPGPTATYLPDVCAELQSPTLTVSGTSVNLQYWERHQLEYHWDGIAVEYLVNGIEWNDVPAPSNSAALGCSAADDVTGWETLSCTQSPPVNACGYPAFKSAFNGPLGGGTTCTDWGTSGVTSYSHRCHVIGGLSPGDTIQFRWRFASDPGAEFAGFYLDDIAVTNITVPTACAPDTCAGQPDATVCSDGLSCTTGDACSGGTCQPGASPPPPAEVADVRLDDAAGTSLTWTAVAGGVVYDVDSSTLSNLRLAGTAGASCLANDLAVASYGDVRPDPTPGEGYYYLIRAQTPCATGTFGMSSGGGERLPTAGCP